MNLGGFILDLNDIGNIKLHEYFSEWIDIYKVGAIRKVTLNKYRTTEKKLREIVPDMKIVNLNRRSYQEILNIYSETHERQTVMDFHHHLKSCVLDAFDEGIIKNDPTRKAIIKGKKPIGKKTKFLNKNELMKLIKTLDLSDRLNYDWIIYFIAKTGIRFSEAVAITVNDLDLINNTVSINKTWNYKEKNSDFQPTKNRSSVRIIRLDDTTVNELNIHTQNLEKDTLVFVDKSRRVHNAEINKHLKKLCEESNVPKITLHCLRHTHASLLLYEGVSIASVAKRLGHSNMATTQKVYLHIIQELESQDNQLLLEFLSDLGQ